MNFKDKLAGAMRQNNSLLCIGLDPVVDKIPTNVKGPFKFFEFSKAIVDATHDLVCAFKPNSAFYEAEGADGIEQLKKICNYITDKYPNIPLILDAKRADIGDTNNGYITYAFDYLKTDAITVNPYLGGDTLEPFLEREDKGIIVLCKTSNPGAGEFQDLIIGGKKLYQVVAETVRDKWNRKNNCLLVIGATYPDELAEVRRLVGDQIDFLVPGLGSQGGDLGSSVKAGINTNKEGMVINSSRSIIFASQGDNFAEAARKIASENRKSINVARGKND